ncbi:L-threonylcarbamoyladenylate synthase [Nocardioides sp.]|uniref:L-threonylcarbamoyladenylate synthase n=1 Tax=Nocardioides sp. TaxID=35761 RepID=UPI003D0D26FE
MTAQPVQPPRKPRRRQAYLPDFQVMNPADIDQLNMTQARRLAQCLADGGVVWFMSDCAYALAADPRNARGVAALDRLLDHSGSPIPVTVGNEATAAKVMKYDSLVRALAGRFWPGGLGIWTPVHNRLGKILVKRLRGEGGVMTRMSRSVIERQLSDALGLPITSAALRQNGVLVFDTDLALELALVLHDERTQGLETFFIRDLRRRPDLANHSTMVKVEKSKLVVVRTGWIDPDDVKKVALSNDGVNWGDAT